MERDDAERNFSLTYTHARERARADCRLNHHFAAYLGDNCVVGHLVARATRANILIRRINIAITIAEKKRGKGDGRGVKYRRRRRRRLKAGYTYDKTRELVPR